MPQVLTVKAIEAAEPDGDRDLVLFDGATKGLFLRVRALESGEVSKGWFLRWKIGGNRRVVQLGSFPELGLAGARDKVAELRAAIRKGAQPVSERTARRRAVQAAVEGERRQAEETARESVADLVAGFVRDHLPSLAPKSAREWERQLRAIVLPAWETRRARDIVRRDAVELLAEVHATRGPVAANRLQALVSRLWRYALDTDRADASPVAGLRYTKGRRPQSRDRVLRGSELRAVWEACGRISYVSGRGLRLILATGARPGEVCSLRWQDLEEVTWPDGGRGLLWRMPGKIRKNRRPFELPLSDLAREILEELRLATGRRVHVLNVRDPDRPSVGLAHQAREVRELSGVGGWVPHDLRRTAATLCADAGVPVGTVELLLGHAQEKLVEVYQRSARLPELRHAARVLEGEIRRAIADPVDGATVLTWRPGPTDRAPGRA